MGELRSGSTTGIVARTESGSFPLGFSRNTVINKIISATEEAGIGDIRTREALLHYVQFRGNLQRALMVNLPLTRIGFEPSMNDGWYQFRAPNLFLPDLVSGKIVMAIYNLIVTNKTLTVAMRQTLTENLAFIALNALDRYEIGLT